MALRLEGVELSEQAFQMNHLGPHGEERCEAARL